MDVILLALQTFLPVALVLVMLMVFVQLWTGDLDLKIRIRIKRRYEKFVYRLMRKGLVVLK